MPLANKAGATGLPTMDREGSGCTILQTGYVSQGWTHIGQTQRFVGLYSRGGQVSQLKNWIDECKIFESFITCIIFVTINNIRQQLQTIGLQGASNFFYYNQQCTINPYRTNVENRVSS